MTEVSTGQLYIAPPITEAVVEVRYRDARRTAEIAKLAKRLKQFYPNELHQRERSVTFNFDKNAAEFTDGDNAFRLTSDDAVDIAIIKERSFTISRLAPYTSWQDFGERCKQLIAAADKMFGRRDIERVGMRYINRLDIPVRSSVVRYEDYLTVYPTLPAGVNLLQHYSMQMHLECADPPGGFHLQTGLIESVVPDTMAVLLDIDLGVIEPGRLSLDELGPLLDRMCIAKDNMFEASITDAARDLFKYAQA